MIRQTFWMIYMGTCLLVLGFALGNLYDVLDLKEKAKPEISEYEQCINLTLEETAYCLARYVSTFYIYNYTKQDVDFETLKESGGDCRDWALLYERMADELGFVGSSHRIETDETAHRFAVIMDDTGYCRLDQNNEPDCFTFEMEENLNETE